MKCFGDMEATRDVRGTTASREVTGPAPWIEDATRENYGLAKGAMDRGFQPYTGEFVAPLSGNENLASELARRQAGGNPYNAEAAGAFRGYGAAPGYKYNFNTVTDQNGPLGSIQSYMDPFIQSVLAPQLRELGLQGAKARQGINSNATQAGAYGDSRHGVVESEQRKNEGVTSTDLVGKAFSQAFGQAMANRQQDAARQFQTQGAQEGADKAALERARTSGIDLTNLDKYNVSRDLGVSSALASTGAVERGVAQAGDDAAFSEFMRKNNFTDQQVQFLTQILKTMPQAQMTTKVGNTDQTTFQPNNSGYQALSTIASMMFL